MEIQISQLIVAALAAIVGYVVSFFSFNEKGKIKSLERSLEDARTILEFHRYNLHLARRRIKAQNQELETLHRALYSKRGESGKVILGVFDGGKNA